MGARRVATGADSMDFAEHEKVSQHWFVLHASEKALFSPCVWNDTEISLQ